MVSKKNGTNNKNLLTAQLGPMDLGSVYRT